MDALCFLLRKQRECEKIVGSQEERPRCLGGGLIRRVRVLFQTRLTSLMGGIFPAGGAHRCASSEETSLRSEAAALTVSTPRIARRPKCHLGGLACGCAMGAAAHPAIQRSKKRVFLAGDGFCSAFAPVIDGE